MTATAVMKLVALIISLIVPLQKLAATLIEMFKVDEVKLRAELKKRHKIDAAEFNKTMDEIRKTRTEGGG